VRAGNVQRRVAERVLQVARSRAAPG
jgi:hypothetical protein